MIEVKTRGAQRGARIKTTGRIRGHRPDSRFSAYWPLDSTYVLVAFPVARSWRDTSREFIRVFRAHYRDPYISFS